MLLALSVHPLAGHQAKSPTLYPDQFYNERFRIAWAITLLPRLQLGFDIRLRRDQQNRTAAFRFASTFEPFDPCP